MKLRLKFMESTFEKARKFLTNVQRKLDFIHRGNCSAQFLRNAHCGFTEKIYCSAKTFTFLTATNFRGLPSRITNTRTLVCGNFGMYCLSWFLRCQKLFAIVCTGNRDFDFVGRVFSTQELTHLMSHPFGCHLSDSIGYIRVVSSGMLLSTFSLGMLTLVKNLSFCSCLSWLFAWHKPWFSSRPLHFSQNVWMTSTPEPESDSWVH